MRLEPRGEVWTGQIFSGCFGDRDGLVGYYIKGRHRRAPRLLPAQCLGTGQAEAEVGTRQVPVFTRGVTVPVLPRAAGAFPVQVGFQVGRWRMAGHGKHA